MKKWGTFIMIALLICGLTVTNPQQGGVSYALAEDNITEFAGGDGSPENPFQVGTTAHLNNVRYYPDKTFVLVADIQFQPADFLAGGAHYNGGARWSPIGSNGYFSGVFDGAGHTIAGLASLSTDANNAKGGLFSVNNGIIQNLNMTGVSLGYHDGDTAILGGIAAVNNGTIQDCSVSGKISSSEGGIGGGISSFNYKRILRCLNMATVAMGDAGGIAGMVGNTGEIIDSKNTGAISSAHQTSGGIVGELNGKVTSCTNTGPVAGLAPSVYAGGIAGEDSGSIIACVNTGSVKGILGIGGIAGYSRSDGTILNSMSTGAVTVSNVISQSKAGGLVGRNEGRIDRSYFLGTLGPETVGDLGGIAGSNAGTVVYCYYLSGQGKKAIGKAISYASFGDQTVFAGFDFVGTWTMDPRIERPVLASNQPAVYSLSYDSNGGSMPSQAALFYMKGSYNPLSLPTKTGMYLLGWCSDAELSTNPVKFIPSGTTGDKQYYAKWGAPILSATSAGYTSVKVAWGSAGSATSYKIYRATSSTGTYSLVHTATSTARSWIDTGRVTGKSYYYKVSPVAAGKTYHYATYKSCKPVPSAPVLTVSRSSTTAKLTWTKVSGASGYQVYRTTSSTGTFQYMATVSSATSTWLDTKVSIGGYYYYKVRAYHMESGTKVYGTFSVVKRV